MITSIKRKISTPSTSPEKKNKTSTEERTAEVQNLQSLDIGEFYTSQEDPSQTTQATDPIASLEHKEKTSAFLEEFNFEKLISKEEDFIKKQEDKISQENKHLYDLYNDLQGLAQEYSLNLKVPEIVVVGMQSDGKSSFVEALLGFQFNTIETQIGTRRPLILQMTNDPTAETPICTFYKEDLSGREEISTLVPEIEGEIKKRTFAVCGKSQVSSKPIILRVQYKNCTNLTIYDTPGFRKVDDDPLGEKIQRMVLNLIKHPHRIIVCLEQSTVEWCNTQVKPIISTIDPKLERTIFVTTKFNNRANQFKDKSEAESYMEGNGTATWFISLPSGPSARNLTDSKFRDKIRESYLSDFKLLSRLNVDEKSREKFGFFNLKRNLEEILNSRYKSCIEPVLTKLTETLAVVTKERFVLTEAISSCEKDDVDTLSMKFIHSFVKHVTSALKGTTLFHSLHCGFTLEEEKTSSGIKNWPNYNHDFLIRNSQYKLYGGAQLERLMSEFELVAHSQEFPPTTNDEVAVTIGLSGLHTTPDYDRGASDLAQKQCSAIFTPLIDVLLNRSKFIMTQVFVMVGKYCRAESKNDKYATFFGELERCCGEFIDKLLANVRVIAFDEFDTFTKVIDWNLIGTCQKLDYDLLNPSKEDVQKRVAELTTEGQDTMITFSRSRDLNDEKCTQIKMVAAKLFAGVRLLFVKYMRAKYNAFFLNPIFTGLDGFVRNHFKGISDINLKEMMGNHIESLRREKIAVDEKCMKLEQQIVKFKSALK